MILSTLDADEPRSERVAVACACLAALTVRAVVAWAMPVINSDGPIYLAQAEAIGIGDFGTAIVNHSYAPGLAALIALVARLGLPVGVAGYTVSVTAGALAVIPLHALARAAFGARTAIAVAFLYAFLPVPARLSAAVLTVGLFVFVSTLGLALAAQVHLRPHPRTALLIGSVAAFAYLVRADGLILLPIAILASSTARGRGLGARCLLVLLALLPAIVAVCAYAHYALPGDGYSFTNKLRRGAAEQFFNVFSFPSLYAVRLVGEDLTESLFAPFLPFLIAGLLVRGREGDTRIRRVWGLLLLVWATGLLKYVDATGIMSKRHMSPLAVLLLPWTAVGILAAGRLVVRVTRRGERAMAWAPAVAVALLCLACLPKLLRVHGKDRVAERAAGLWLREVVPPGRPILCGSTCVPFYAERRTVSRRIAQLPVRRAFAELERLGVEFIVRDRGLEDAAPQFVRALEVRPASLVRRFSAGETEVVEVYRLESP